MDRRRIANLRDRRGRGGGGGGGENDRRDAGTDHNDWDDQFSTEEDSDTVSSDLEIIFLPRRMADNSEGEKMSSSSLESDGELEIQMIEYAFKPYKLIKIKYKYSSPPKCPTARSGHRIICTDSNLYCLGGFNPLSEMRQMGRPASYLFQEFWRYNFVSRRWKLILRNGRDMPDELASNAVTTYNNIMIVLPVPEQNGHTKFRTVGSCLALNYSSV